MRRVVVILGAGASVSAGLPSLAGVFEDESVKAYLASDGRDFEIFLRKYIWGPRNVTEAERWRSLNLEEVLTLLRLWEDNNQSPLNFKKNRNYQRQLLGCVYRSVYMDKRDNGARDYNHLIVHCDRSYDSVTWASFNWDAKFEQAFYYAFLALGQGNNLPRCHPGVNGWEGTNPKHLLLKLHGSVSWLEGPKTGTAQSLRFGAVKGARPIEKAWDSYLAGDPNALSPIIAEPSFFKHERIKKSKFLWSQWNTFDKALGQADDVLIVGYSLPDGDAMAKQSLLTLVARNPNAKVIVVDPDGDGQVLSRYTRVVGGPPRLSARKETLSDFIARLDAP